jgi:titin
MGNGDNGVEIAGNAHDNVVGGLQPTFSVIPQNAISANGGHGVAILEHAHDNDVNFSFIGTDVFGKGDHLGNAKAGVFLGEGTHSTTVGSTNPELLTIISGNRGDGIEMQGTSANTVIGSLIGTDKDGGSLPNSGNGIRITDGFDNRIGGTKSGEANVIAFNLGNGVFVESGQRNTIRANSIHDNALLGIFLGAGANNNQPAPVLTSAVPVPGGIRVTGTVTSAPKTWVTIDLFANTAGGEGQFYLGSVRVRTNAAGIATFTLVGRPPAGANFLTATATDDEGNTSEFSQSFLL